MRIDPVIWPALSALLDEYLGQPDESRAAWLDGLGPEHADILPTLREVVTKGTARGDAFLETLPAVTPPDEDTGYAPLAPGSVVGPYRLIRELGRGGMSLVWLAERVDGLIKRKVALKLPIVQLHSDTLAERFARERDILAGLTHPQIARLYDAGITASGKSYLALEYVEGEPITTHCEKRSLNLKARLELFLDISTSNSPKRYVTRASEVRMCASRDYSVMPGLSLLPESRHIQDSFKHRNGSSRQWRGGH
jgi:eukaryotic-like serine/threonine-protein kinase